jgi:hypothetical protein
MSISKKIVVSLSFLAIIGGISIAIISVSANGKLFDTQAIAFIKNDDLSGYKTYLINQETNRINNIDQSKFDEIKAKYEAAKPLMDLQSKYEPQLKELAANSDETGFVTLFQQYKDESKAIKETIKDNRKGEKYLRQNITQEQKEQIALREYDRAVRDIESGREYNLGRMFEGRGYHRLDMIDKEVTK